VFNICLFCKYPFTLIDVKKQVQIEGHQVTQIECHNCLAEFKLIAVIQRGPKKKFVSNETSDGMAKQSTGGK
jgi:hypothetical protein